MFSENIQATGLSDKIPPPDQYNYWQKIQALYGVLVANSYYETTVAKVTGAINYNISPWTYIFNKYTWANVGTILNAYMNLVSDGKIPSYELRNIPDRNIKKLSEDEQKKVINAVANNSGYDAKVVKSCLDQLYWYTQDKTITKDLMLRPQNKEKYIASTSGADAVKNEQISGSNLFEGLGLPAWTGTALLGIAVVGIGAYGLSQVNVATSGFRKA
ncbi:MAG: hypothetical protein OQK82_08965 [Candidatus Pacearchaeota archaeon]|nr:hypothetical protein [Candidatus Pacearchaeota archaeon]